MPSAAFITHCPLQQATSLRTLTDSLAYVIGSLISIDLIDAAEYIALIKHEADILAVDLEQLRQQQERRYPRTDGCARKIDTLRARFQVFYGRVAELKARERGIGEGRQNAPEKVVWEERYVLEEREVRGDSENSDSSCHTVGEGEGMGEVTGSGGGLRIPKAA